MRKVHKLRAVLNFAEPPFYSQKYVVMCGYSWLFMTFISSDDLKVTCKRCLKIMGEKQC